MRVLHCVPTMWAGSGGPPRSVSGLVNSLLTADPSIRVEVLSTSYGMTAEWLHTLRTVLGGATLTLAHQIGAHTRAISPGMCLRLARRVRNADVVLVHSLFHPTSSLCMAVCRIAGTPYLVMPHGTLSPYTFSHGHAALKRLWWHAAERRLVNSARGVIFTAPGEAAKAARLGLRPHRFIVPLPVVPPSVPDTNTDGSRVLFLGRLDPKKNVEVLIEAFAQVARSRARARLVIAGTGTPSYEAELAQRVRSLGVERAVEFTGFMQGERKTQTLAGASVFVLASSEENFGVAVAEAMAAHVPVVVSPGVDLAGDVQKHQAGLVVPAEPGCVAAAVSRLLDNAEERRQMGLNGYAYVRDHLAPEKVGPRFLRVCRWAAKGARVGA